MHICFLTNEYPGVAPAYGGVGVFTRTLGRALAQQGHRVTVVGSYEEGGSVSVDGLEVVKVPYASLRGAGALVTSRRLVRALLALHERSQIDVLDSPELGLASVPATFPPLKVLRLHGGHHFFAIMLGKSPRLWRGWLERRSFRRADAFCAVSAFVADVTRRLLRLGNRPIEVLPNPVDTDLFRPRPDLATVPGRIVFVGTLTEKKGVRQLVQAMSEVARRNPAARLIAVGRDTPHEGAGATTYGQAVVREVPPDIRERVEFWGVLSPERVSEVLATAAVCVYPSHMESQGIAVCEAMAAGRPVIASKLGPGEELIEQGQSGLLCDPFDPSDIAQKILAVLTDPRAAIRMGEVARIRAVDRYAVAAAAERNIAFYGSCQARRRAGQRRRPTK